MKKYIAMLLVVATILALAAPAMAVDVPSSELESETESEPKFPSYDDEISYYPIDPNAEAVFDLLSRAGFYKLSYELSTSDLQKLLDKVAAYRENKEESKENVGTNLLWTKLEGSSDNVTVEGLESKSDKVTLKVNINDLTVDNTNEGKNVVSLQIISDFDYDVEIVYSDKDALDALYPLMKKDGNFFTFELTNLSAGTYIVAIPTTYTDKEGKTYTQTLYVTIIVECTHEDATGKSLLETKTVKKASLFDDGYGYTYCTRCGKLIYSVNFPSYWDTLVGRITVFKALEKLVSSIAAKLAAVQG